MGWSLLIKKYKNQLLHTSRHCLVMSAIQSSSGRSIGLGDKHLEMMKFSIRITCVYPESSNSSGVKYHLKR